MKKSIKIISILLGILLLFNTVACSKETTAKQNPNHYAKITETNLLTDKLTNENVLILVLRHYEKNSPSDWRIYAPIVNTPHFKNFSRYTALPIGCVEEKEDGEFTVYGKQFARIW